MQVRISSRKTEITPRLEELVTAKVNRLERYLEGLDTAEVHFSEERNPRIAEKEVCEITLEGHGHHVRAKVRGRDGYQAIDRACDKLEHQLHKLKTKLIKQSHGNGEKLLDIPEAEDVSPLVAEPPMSRIVKMKSFDIGTMTADDAVLQMDLLQHDFYFFHNKETGQAAVVYRRDDGDIGIIDDQPE